ncbi:ubiquinone/menaquinone biosynthesis methyltransferase [Chloroherpeton thalassium ATCC 35110]|uniref:Demethylmenaquinone methyltransferase n=2 Tax=Chloroherpeton thalassium TaxID=100716 RepID=B3QU87_CHLT3|nr:ubiquinone/menaquinone biosynthesis methyltransferase [Chloroherpeton thalassium ATCC 35110]
MATTDSTKIAESLVETKSHQHIQHMFDEVAPTYDLLNHVLSMGTDFYWRWRARQKAKSLLNHIEPKVLDVATGTGDLALEMTKLRGASVTGLDLSPEMLVIAKKKCPDLEFRQGKAESLPFDDQTFNLVTAGFGVRNFENLSKGMQEFYRVLKPGGAAIILEPMVPRQAIIKSLYMFYFKSVLPKLAKLFTKSSFAYDYLPRSVEAFPQCERFLPYLTQAGFNKAEFYPMTFETAIMYVAVK